MAAPEQPWFGSFVTREVFGLPDGTRLLWDVRWHRKHAGQDPGGSTWRAPTAIAWWMAVLFAIGSACFAFGSFRCMPLLSAPRRTTHLLRRIHVLHDRPFSAVRRGCDTPTALGLRTEWAPFPPEDLAPPHRLVGRGDPAARDAVVQPDHPACAPCGAGRVVDTSPVWRPGCAGFRLLPGGELDGLGRGVRRRLGLATRRDFPVDHRVEPSRLGGVRRLGHRLVHQIERPAPQPGPDQLGHVRRRPLLLRRVRAPVARAHPGGSGHRTSTRSTVGSGPPRREGPSL